MLTRTFPESSTRAWASRQYVWVFHSNDKGVDCESKFLFLLANVSYFLVLDKVSTNAISSDFMPETFSESPQWSVRIPSL
jgi:hypothetical protein